jgi:hypothetical protein
MQSLRVLLEDWRRSRVNMETIVKKMPRIIGAECVRVVKQNFNLHGYDSGSGFEEWKQRSDKTNESYARNRTKGKQGIYKGSVFSPNKPVLKQTLNLYNNIKYEVRGFSSVKIGVDKGLVPYAIAHNEGLNHQPKRQFMPYPSQPPNQKMIRQITKKYEHEREKALGKFKK